MRGFSKMAVKTLEDKMIAGTFSWSLEDFEWSKYSYIIAIALFVLLIAAMAITFNVKREKRLFTTAELAVSGVLVALSFGLSYIVIFKMPQDGSITLFSLAPLAILCWYLGFKRSLIICFTYSLLQMIQPTTLYHPVQILLDFILPYSVYCIIPLFKRLKLGGFVTGIIVASILRFAMHVLSGVVFFAEYAGDTPPLIYSVAYNSFVFVDIAIAIAACIPLLLSRDVDNQFKRLIRNQKRNRKQA